MRYFSNRLTPSHDQRSSDSQKMNPGHDGSWRQVIYNMLQCLTPFLRLNNHPLLGRRAICSASILRLSALLIDPPLADEAVPLANLERTIDSLIGLTAAYDDCRIEGSRYPGIASERMILIVWHVSWYREFARASLPI
jgi:hypothetical protein